MTEATARVLERSCLLAATRGIEQEIERCERFAEGLTSARAPAHERSALEARLLGLRMDLERFRALAAEDYALPEPLEITGWVDEAAEGAELHRERAAAGDPLLRVMAVDGGGFAALSPGTPCRMTVYRVYPRAEPSPGHYVCVARLRSVTVAPPPPRSLSWPSPPPGPR